MEADDGHTFAISKSYLKELLEIERKHPLSDFFPPTGEFDEDASDIERGADSRVMSTAEVYESLLNKEDRDRFNKNPDHPDFRRAPSIYAHDGTEILQPMQYEQDKFPVHKCFNCDSDDGNYDDDEQEYAANYPRTLSNPNGCYGTSDMGTQTFETRIKDNRSLSIVCETEGENLKSIHHNSLTNTKQCISS